jgi:hypothetical protein
LALQGDISFLVDTGADKTLLMPLNSLTLGVDFSKLTGEEPSVGIGGASHNFTKPALLLFVEHRKFLHLYRIDLLIAPPSPEIMDVPSLLGRDVIDRWRMVYNPSRKWLSFTVLSADATIPL